MNWPFVAVGAVFIVFGGWMPRSLRKARQTAAARGVETVRMDHLLGQRWLRAYPYFMTVAGIAFIVVGVIG